MMELGIYAGVHKVVNAVKALKSKLGSNVEAKAYPLTLAPTLDALSESCDDAIFLINTSDLKSSGEVDALICDGKCDVIYDMDYAYKILRESSWISEEFVFPRIESFDEHEKIVRDLSNLDPLTQAIVPGDTC